MRPAGNINCILQKQAGDSLDFPKWKEILQDKINTNQR